MSEIATITERIGTRPLALGGMAVLLGASVSVLGFVTDVVGGGQTEALVGVVLASVLASTLLARTVQPLVAFAIAMVLVAVGGSWYFLTLPEMAGAGLSSDVLIADALALLSGLSILRITNAGQWTLAATPGPVFLAWYLAVRHRYAAATLVGGSFLSLFVLTGDASTATTLIGAVGGAAAVGFGEIERRTGVGGGVDLVAVVLAVMVVATLTIGVVPGGAGTPLSPGSNGGGTVEGSLVDTADRIQIRGSIRLSPEVRFTVRADQAAQWRVAGYDRYTGDGWLRTGGGVADAVLESPAGRTRTVSQTYRVESTVSTMPAAWKPVELTHGASRATVTTEGGLQPRSSLGPGAEYGVISHVPVGSPSVLRRAGTDYPSAIRERYLQLPDSTPDRLAERTTQLTARAETPYDTARVIEVWLEQNREYSLDVTRPDGSIADAFLFDMERGYCTYYATTMVVMLRSQGIPARFVTGYTTGQAVAEDRWVVRGLDSHAWVEVYFPGHGWIPFDPTPAGPREAVEQARLEQARSEGTENVDTSASEPEPTPTPETPANGSGTANESTPTAGNITGNITDPFGGPGLTGTLDGGGLPSPSREELGLAIVVVLGAGAALRRSGVGRRAVAELWLRRHPNGSPAERIEGAFDRLEYLLASHGRERRSSETVRQYLASVNEDRRARRLGTLYERAVYAGAASPEEATEATRLVRELTADLPVRERLWP